MTAAMVDVWLQSAHATAPLPDGPGYWRTACCCGWMAETADLAEADARRPCGAEAEQQRGRARLAAYLARQKHERVT